MAKTLPGDIIIEILTKLPADSLLPWRIVSKFWNNVITKLYLNYATQTDTRNLFFLKIGYGMKKKKTHISTVNCNSLDNVTDIIVNHELGLTLNNTVQVIGSCNGIVCLIGENKVCLVNPCTSEYKVFQFEEKKFLRGDCVGAGFGYDVVTDDYIVVQILKTGRVLVNSLYSCSSEEFVYETHRILQKFGTYVNGFIYWLVECDRFMRRVIIYFDAKEKRIREMHFPFDQLKGFNAAMGSLRGKLYVLIATQLWVYNVTESSWFKQATLTICKYCRALADGGQYRSIVPTVLCYCKNGEVILCYGGADVYVYDQNNYRNHHTLFSCFVRKRMDGVVTYVASFVKLKSGTYLRGVE